MKLKCGHDDNLVYKTLDNFFLDSITRHRVCLKCGMTFETVETCSGRSWKRSKHNDDATPDMFDDDYAERMKMKKEREADEFAQRVADKLKVNE